MAIEQRILIFGKGYLATVFAAHYQAAGHAVSLYDTDEYSFTDADTIRSLVDKEKPTRVINTVAFTATAAAELPENRQLAFTLNVQVPCTILEVLTPLNIPWLHFSTGMMFDGTKPDGSGWLETDTPTPQNYYSWTKMWGDGAITPFAEAGKLIIARIHLPISSVHHARNFLDRLASFDRGVEVPSSLTIIDDAIPALDQLFAQAQYGLFNVVNEGSISPFQIMQEMKKAGLIESTKEILPLSLAELNAKGGAKQSFPHLSGAKLAAAGIQMPDAHTSLRKVLQLLAQGGK